MRRDGADKLHAILQTCRERARPVVLTAATAILGVLPIAFGLNLELLNHETTIGAPSTQWWISLSSAIVFGLAFSTVLTLVVTPAMLMLFTRENRAPGGPRRSWLASVLPGRHRRGRALLPGRLRGHPRVLDDGAQRRARTGALGQPGARHQRYVWNVVGQPPGPVAASNGLELRTGFGLADALPADLVIVVASLAIEAFRNRPLFAFLRSLRNQHRLIGAISNRTLILARAGLLHGRRVTTGR